MLTGLVDALAESPLLTKITLAVTHVEAISARLKDRKGLVHAILPKTFLQSERVLSRLSGKGFDLFLSPYPKLPLFGVHCPAVHTVHDVLDLNDPLYRRRIRTLFDKYRLKWALRRAALTWYDSLWSRAETSRLTGTAGRTPRVRHLGIDDRFDAASQEQDATVLEKYALTSKGYILVVGNGLPHKNLGLLLGVADRISHKLLFIGVSKRNRSFWENQYPGNTALWFEQATDEEMTTLLRHAFCLAQPSLAEGYGYPPLEAMACGTPAVVSQIDVLVETGGGHALVADPRDGGSWIEAFECLKKGEFYHQQAEKGLLWTAPLKGRAGWQGQVTDIEELIGSPP